MIHCTTIEVARLATDRILDSMLASDCVPGFSVHLSCGFAFFEGQSQGDLLGIADAALYAEKQRRAK